MGDELTRATTNAVLGAAKVGPFSLKSMRDVFLSVIGDNNALVAQWAEDDAAEMLEDLRRRVEAVEREVQTLGASAERARPAVQVEILREAAAVLPACVDERVRTAKMNALARRIVYARGSNRALVEHWWRELEKLGEGEIRVLFMIGDATATFDGLDIILRKGGATIHRERLSPLDFDAINDILGRHQRPGEGALFSFSHPAGWVLPPRARQLLALIRDPSGLGRPGTPQESDPAK